MVHLQKAVFLTCHRRRDMDNVRYENSDGGGAGLPVTEYLDAAIWADNNLEHIVLEWKDISRLWLCYKELL